MIAVPSNARILVARHPIDFRAGHDRLAALVTQALADDPFCGTIFVFRSSDCSPPPVSRSGGGR
ncbi:IS66 family insertion sequence element accessory protein TnpB [Rhodovibrio sodomensis]|uniref:IS66 family insertion sequence element accessory protein TnpB n=1 Tax=Rhodovibrio sodomensis TaxID=1088 RepID=UPI0019030B28